MESSSLLSFASLLLILNSLTLTSSKPLFNLTTDEHALLAFKAIASDPYAVLRSNWSTNVPSICYWIGVSCGPKHRRVTGLNVSGFGLGSTIAPHLGNLSFLRSLDISLNRFTGSIPSQLSNLRRLEEINIAGNQISGSIPNGMLNMSSLMEMNMRDNRLSGTLSNDICSNATPKLQRVYLSGNQLSGEIPVNINKCTELEDMRLRDNHFSGIPNEIGSLTKLRIFSLWSNNFTGRIPVQLGNLTSLERLYLDQNYLSGELPQELRNLVKLEIFSVFNNSLSGSFPLYMFNISSLNAMDLSFNQFSGSLPENIGEFSVSNLEEFQLCSNRFSGKIPSFIANATKLTVLELQSNAFSGLVPNFGSLRRLQILRIWGNKLSGAESPTQELGFLLPLTNCRYLEDLQISENPFNGTLPNSIGNLSTSLRIFHASRCNIKGVIPSEIGNLSSLIGLYLFDNQMTGSIPTSIGNLKKLGRLELSDNQLQGHISVDLCRLSNLGELWLRKNMLTGPIPKCLAKLEPLRDIDLSANQLNSTIPSNFWNLRDLLTLNLSSNNLSGKLSPQIGNLKAVYQVDLSSNQFIGDIPSVIDGCESLEYLSLSNNKFTGSIPESLGNIRGLVTLNLSINYLSGSIPKSLEELHYLRDFNVTYNKLAGEIPNGGCFVNFTAQSFVHNSALCGATRFQVPSCSKNHGASRLKRLGRLIKYILPTFILTTTLVIIVLMLIWRQKKKTVTLSTDISLDIEWRRISYMELERATTSFSESNLLGRGSSGMVFKGTLSDGLKIAVKVFNLQLEGAVKSFVCETKILSDIRHRNLVRIIGCCSNMEFKALILEYMPKGSLDKWLYSDTYWLDLGQRLDIAIDVALTLEYLHHRYSFPIVHRDIKPSNILFDEEMTAHVSDFGVAKLFDNGEVVVQTQTLATVGYAAPEYGMEGKVSTNGDVYSYGIMLLEIFTGKKPTDNMFSGELNLKEWVGEALQNNAIIEVLPPDLLSIEDEHFNAKQQCILSIFELAMKCLVISSEERMNMIEAGAHLHKIKGKFCAATMVHEF